MILEEGTTKYYGIRSNSNRLLTHHIQYHI